MTLNEEKFFNDLRRKTNPNKLCWVVSYEHLEQEDLLNSKGVIEKLKQVVSGNMHFKVRKKAYETCKKMGIDCDRPKAHFEVDEEERAKMEKIFEYMRKKGWLKPYNSPKFRHVYSILYPKEYCSITRKMGDKRKKKFMFDLYRKYYFILVENK